MAVHAGEYITGLSVTFKIDGRERIEEHLGSGRVINSERLYLDAFEHIEFASCTYSAQGVHSLAFKTNTSKSFSIEGDKGKGEHRRDISLKEYAKAVIGFRGLIAESLLDLYIYVAPRLDLLSDAVIGRRSGDSNDSRVSD